VKEKVVAAVEVTRPTNALGGGLGAAVGGFVGGSLGASVVVAAVVTAFGTGAGNAVNDYYDADIDALNRPDRPIPSGRLSRRGAACVSVGLFAAALALTVALLPALAVVIGAVNLAVLVVYSSHLKRVPLVGNVAVAYLAGSAFLFGGAAAGGVEYTVAPFGLAALANLGREIVKDVEDVEGDASEGARTLPVVYGERPALGLATVSALAAVALSPAPYFVFEGFGVAYLAAVAAADALLVEGVRRSWGSPGSGQRLLKTAMLVALVAFIVARFVGA